MLIKISTFLSQHQRRQGERAALELVSRVNFCSRNKFQSLFFLLAKFPFPSQRAAQRRRKWRFCCRWFNYSEARARCAQRQREHHLSTRCFLKENKKNFEMECVFKWRRGRVMCVAARGGWPQRKREIPGTSPSLIKVQSVVWLNLHQM